MTNEQIAIRQHLSKARPESEACGCMGPQWGQPLCPCRMNWVEEVNGKYYQIHEHRSLDGVTHTAEYLCDVGEPLNENGCPVDRLKCRNMQLVKTRAYWLDYACGECGHKITTARNWTK